MANATTGSSDNANKKKKPIFVTKEQLAERAAINAVSQARAARRVVRIDANGKRHKEWT